MDIPQWNNEWDPPDPLKGRRGWSAHRYVSAGILALLAAFSVVLMTPYFVLPALARRHRQEAELDRQHKTLQEAIGAANHFHEDPPRE